MLKLFAILFLLSGCNSIAVPPAYVYKEIPTRDFIHLCHKYMENLFLLTLYIYQFVLHF